MDYVSGWALCHHVWTLQEFQRQQQQRPDNDDFIMQYRPSRVMQGARRLGKFIRQRR